MEEVAGSSPVGSTKLNSTPFSRQNGVKEKMDLNSAKTLKQAMKCPEKSGFFLFWFARNK